MKTPQLVDAYGRPVERAVLTEEVARPTLGSVRSPLTGYPAEGLTPVRLGSILRDADAGDGLRYLDLAEAIEERNEHYTGILGTRKRSVTQIGITVKAASEAPEDVARADMVRDWLDRDELADELFDILDCIGKGFSATEIIWDTSEGQWMPLRLERRDPRWFRFDRSDLTTLKLLSDAGEEKPLDGFKFVVAMIRAKSGLPLRSGLARLAAWNWMFKGYTLRDWAVFTQTYGQPVRVGRYGQGASEADKDKLYRAVANIAGDCAAIIPESMRIEFVETSSVSATGELYESRADWLDRQLSKAVLGQTATTDAVTGGLGSGKEHRQVQEDIERADARALAAVLNRDLIRPWMQLEFPGIKAYPKLKIERLEPEDVAAVAQAAESFVRAGGRISARKLRERLGFDEPEDEADILRPEPAPAPPPGPGKPPSGPSAPGAGDPAPGDRAFKRVSGVFKRGPGILRGTTALQASGPPAPLPRALSEPDDLAGRMEAEAAAGMDALIARIEAMVAAAGSLPELAEMLRTGFPDLGGDDLAQVLAMGLIAADLAGRVAVAEGE